jgi:hypothetical protein
MTSPWQRTRQASGWIGGLTEWTKCDNAYISVTFSWQLVTAYQHAVWMRHAGYNVFAGGPAVTLNPSMLQSVASLTPPPGETINALTHHNPNATRTSRGCIRACNFCAVPIIEGKLTELDNWIPRPIVCDDNFLATSKKHFNRAIDKLKPIEKVDFNQGLDARLLTEHHATRLGELDTRYIRLAWDNTRDEPAIMRAFQRLRDAGFPARHISFYVLFGFDDTPEDALYRLTTIRDTLKARWFPMRYQPLDATRRNAYVAPNWTDYELKRFQSYWSNTKYLGSIPFEEYEYRPGKKEKTSVSSVVKGQEKKGKAHAIANT